MWIGQKEEFYHDEGGETVEKVAQRMMGCPIIGSVQRRVQRNFE